MTPRTIWRALPLIAALTAISCSGEPEETLAEPGPVSESTDSSELTSANKILILSSSVNNGLNSREAKAAAAYMPTWQIDVVTPEQWLAMTAEQFMAYRAIIIGDAACTSGDAAFQAAVQNRNNWGAIVDGKVAILSTDPVSNNTPLLVENGVRFVLSTLQRRTGMYISLGCAYQSAPADTVVTLLEPFGTFKAQGVPGCASTGHLFKMSSSLLNGTLTDTGLPGTGGCVARSVFTAYPEHTFSFTAMAVSTASRPVPGSQVYTDFMPTERTFVGAPYMLVRGSMSLSAGCGMGDYIPSSEECDFGEGINGVPAVTGQDPLTTCSYSCHFTWCGDGVVDTDRGEECDNGVYNGRTNDTQGAIGACTALCKLPHVQAPPPANRPPTALCRNVTVVAEYTCGVPASIDNFSYDPDGDPVSCTQSPAGPFNIGDTTVTLTCADPGGHQASCTGVVTVVDQVPPTVALVGPADPALECTQGAEYPDPGATASDQCEGALPASSISRHGSVSMGTPGTYPLNYEATDSAGNTSSPVTRTVAVSDTLPPTLTLMGQANMALECGSAYSDPGVVAHDQCAGDLTAAIQREGFVNSTVPGTYAVSYNVTDPAGHAAPELSRIVTVSDSLAPVVTVNGPLSVALECGTPYIDPGATANDVCAGPLPVVTSGTVDAGLPGSYAVSYSAMDPSGNIGVSSSIRTVTVIDTLAPSITLAGTSYSTLECGFTYVDPGVSATDACSGDLGNIAVSGSVNPAAPGSYTLSYTATDASGNSASTSRTVAVQDTLAPQLRVRQGGPGAIQCNGTPWVDPGATAWDLCGGDLTASVTASSNLDQTREGQYTVTYSAKDAAGHVGTTTRQITVVGPCSTNTCLNIHLSDYNLFLLGDYNGGHDVVGKVAAGGNITMTDFSVGTGLPDSNISNALVAGGNLTLSRGGVWGDARYGGTYSADASVVYPRGSAASGTPIDFAARFTELRNLSSQLASRPANGSTVREVWGGVMLRGTNPTLNVFDVNASAFNGAVFWYIEAPAGSLAVVNIRGASASFGGFGTAFGGGIDQHGVLYNFVDATSITAQGFGFFGTVLAPYAHVNFNNGSWDGGIYARSFTGNAEGHINPLTDRDICQ